MERKYDPVLAFDIYGTLLDTGSIAAALSGYAHLSEEDAEQLSVVWRKYQLEYTWRMNSMQVYEPFDVVTRQSLHHAALESKVNISEETLDALVLSYTYLKRLKRRAVQREEAERKKREEDAAAEVAAVEKKAL